MVRRVHIASGRVNRVALNSDKTDKGCAILNRQFDSSLISLIYGSANARIACSSNSLQFTYLFFPFAVNTNCSLLFACSKHAHGLFVRNVENVWLKWNENYTGSKDIRGSILTIYLWTFVELRLPPFLRGRSLCAVKFISRSKYLFFRTVSISTHLTARGSYFFRS